MSHHKKQSFTPYVVIIIVAVVLIAVANAAVVYNSNQISQDRDSLLIRDQQKVISSISNTSLTNSKILSEIQTEAQEAMLYHGVLIYQMNNNSHELQTLIQSHNEMIKAIENATGHHTPIINVHNTYCTIINPAPVCKHHK